MNLQLLGFTFGSLAFFALIGVAVFFFTDLFCIFPERKIVGVAIMDGPEMWAMSAPNRHCNVIRLMVKNKCKTPIVGEQGFILNDGTFISREEGLKLARKNDQFIFDCSPGSDQLFSENLW